jgi:crotonobetainyl-CoA:carnitine CoA-transferase CaiB-like acyl-CoA transferase
MAGVLSGLRVNRFQNREACVAELDAVFASRALAEWRERLATVEGVWAPIQTARELHDDPQAHANDILLEHGLSWDDIARLKEAGAIA